MPKKKNVKPYVPDKPNMTKPISISQAIILLLEKEIQRAEQKAKEKGSSYPITNPRKSARDRLDKAIKRDKETLGLKQKMMSFQNLHAWACKRYNLTRFLGLPQQELLEDNCHVVDDSDINIEIQDLDECNRAFNELWKENKALHKQIEELKRKLEKKVLHSKKMSIAGAKGRRRN